MRQTDRAVPALLLLNLTAARRAAWSAYIVHCGILLFAPFRIHRAIYIFIFLLRSDCNLTLTAWAAYIVHCSILLFAPFRIYWESRRIFVGGAVCLYCILLYIAFVPVKGYCKVLNKIRRRLRKPNLTLTAWAAYIVHCVILLLPLSGFIGVTVQYFFGRAADVLAL